jgi:hypothetical protein
MTEQPYEEIGDIAVFRLGGGHGLGQCVQQVGETILRAKQAGLAGLLVGATAIGFGPPSIVERHWLITEWAMAGHSAVRVALVIRPEFVDPQRFGTVLARSRGLDFRAFTDRASAMAWLRDRRIAG